MALSLSADGGYQGAVGVVRSSDQSRFSPPDVIMAEDFASQAGIAFELAKARAAQQQVEDRERIARDLHDHVIQRIFATGLSMQGVARRIADEEISDRLTQMGADLNETIRQIRTSIFALKSPATEDGPSVRGATLQVIKEVTPVVGFRPQVHLLGPLDVMVRSELIDDVVAVLRESLTNVGRHSGATSCQVALEATPQQRLTLTVSDNGRGLGTTTRRSGLDNLRVRAIRLGGYMDAENGPDGGLLLRWSVPLH